MGVVSARLPWVFGWPAVACAVILGCRVGLTNLGSRVSCVVLSRSHWLRKLKVNLRSRITQSSRIRVRWRPGSWTFERVLRYQEEREGHCAVALLV